MHYLRIGVVMVALTWVVGNPVLAASEGERESLHGLPGVAVVVEAIKSEVETDGLTRSQIQTDVELALRSNGIRVLTREEMSITPGSPWLYIVVNFLKIPGRELYAFDIRVELQQRVSLIPSPERGQVFAATWLKSRTGVVGKSSLSEVRKSIEDIVKVFANDFLAMNPR